jgi:hypothetical protein
MYVKPLLAMGGISAVLAGLLSILLTARHEGKENSAVKVITSSAPTPIATLLPAETAPRRERSTPDDPIATALGDVSKRISPIIAASGLLKQDHDKLRSEGRDQEWASRSEKMLSDEYNKLAGAKDGLQSATLVCGTTICELSGAFSSHGDELKRAMQEPELAAKMWGLGYRNVGEGYGKGADGLEDYVVYYRREAPETVKVTRLPILQSQDSISSGR